MSAKFLKLMMVVSLLFGILGCNLSSIINWKEDPNNLPVRSVRVTMDIKHRKQLFAQLENFANLHSLQYSLKLYSKDESSYLIAIYGTDFQITAGGDDIDPDRNDIVFYNKGATPVPQQKIDQLFADLDDSLRNISNATIADQKSWNIRVDAKHKDEIFSAFFTRLQNFAHQHSLTFTSSSKSSSDQSIKTFIVEMVGNNDFHVTISAVTNSPITIDVDFYIDVTDLAVMPNSQELVNELFKDMSNFFGDYSDVTITKQP